MTLSKDARTTALELRDWCIRREEGLEKANSLLAEQVKENRKMELAGQRENTARTMLWQAKTPWEQEELDAQAHDARTEYVGARRRSSELSHDIACCVPWVVEMRIHELRTQLRQAIAS